jgi:biotin carboxyl carrier protein
MSSQTPTSPQPPVAPPAVPAAPRPSASSPEALDEIIKTTKAHGWWALWAITFAVVAALIWSFVATLPTQATATGVIPSFLYSTAITSPAEGKLALNLDIGRNIKKGEPLASVQPYDGSPAVTIDAPKDGQVVGIYVGEGDSVELGTKIALLVTQPDTAKGVGVVTFLPASSALIFTEGQTAQITVTNVATSDSAVVDATISHIADIPASLSDMETISGSATASQQWLEESDGSPYLVSLIIEKWPTDNKALTPEAGQIVAITNTYGSAHPISMLFGGS